MRVFRCSKFGFFFPERRVEVYSFNRDYLWGPNNEIASFSFCRRPKFDNNSCYWRASEASETLSGLFNRESQIYILYIYIVCANFVLITRKEGGA